MMIPGGINRDYSDVDIFAQRFMLSENIHGVESKVIGRLLTVNFSVHRPYFSTVYDLSVFYHSQDLHFVMVKNLEIVPSLAIHMYSDRTLCLYYPPDISPYRRIWIYRDLIPLATQWVQNYERWLFNGHDWKGWEAPGHWFLLQQLNNGRTDFLSQTNF